MHQQRGNILFLILLAVVLFAALSYAVTSSMRGGGKSASTEAENLLASQMIQAAGLLENSMNRAMLIDNIKPYGFDLSDPLTNSTTNGTCTQQSCRMFTSKGGGTALPYAPDWALNGARYAYNFYMVNIIGVGTSEPELTISFRGLTKSMCEAINRVANTTDITLSSGDPWDWAGVGSINYSGTMTGLSDRYGTIGDTNATLKGKKTFCYYHGSEGYYFMHVLIER